jgi:hypothetical protein
MLLLSKLESLEERLRRIETKETSPKQDQPSTQPTVATLTPQPTPATPPQLNALTSPVLLAALAASNKPFTVIPHDTSTSFGVQPSSPSLSLPNSLLLSCYQKMLGL